MIIAISNVWYKQRLNTKAQQPSPLNSDHENILYWKYCEYIVLKILWIYCIENIVNILYWKYCEYIVLKILYWKYCEYIVLKILWIYCIENIVLKILWKYCIENIVNTLMHSRVSYRAQMVFVRTENTLFALMFIPPQAPAGMEIGSCKQGERTPHLFWTRNASTKRAAPGHCKALWDVAHTPIEAEFLAQGKGRELCDWWDYRMAPTGPTTGSKYAIKWGNAEYGFLFLFFSCWYSTLWCPGTMESSSFSRLHLYLLVMFVITNPISITFGTEAKQDYK